MDFVWADLSSYQAAAARRFYSTIFDWRFRSFSQQDGVEYQASGETGIFDMPAFFAKISMPPFWMSYLNVPDCATTVAKAKSFGASVDVDLTPFADGTMALIRDPLGAGFTIYDGTDIRAKGPGYGQLVWNELVTADPAPLIPFYREVLGLTLTEDGLHTQAGQRLASLRVVEAVQRFDKVYWLPLFAVDDLNAFTQRVIAAGGEPYARHEDQAQFFDPEGALFGVKATGAERKSWLGRLLS